MRNTILKGHVIDTLKTVPDNTFHCVVTSPPYFGLRAYGTDAQVWPYGPSHLMCAEHDWGSTKVRKSTPQRDHAPGGGFGTTRGAESSRSGMSFESNTGNVCNVCNAWRGELGSEPTPELFIAHMVQVFEEVKRVMRDDGVCWVNMGDSYASGQGTCFNPGGGEHSLGKSRKEAGAHPLDRGNVSTLRQSGLKPMDLCMIPHKLAIALQQAGWWVRMDVIWNKPNPMPESVDGWRWERHKIKTKAGWTKETHPSNQEGGKSRIENSGGKFDAQATFELCPGCDKCNSNGGMILRKGSWRPSRSHEYIFMLTKSESYYADGEAVREKHQDKAGIERFSKGMAGKSAKGFEAEKWAERDGTQARPPVTMKNREYNPAGRNKRSVWEITTQPYADAHFATFPEQLPKTCILASTSEKGCCSACGSPYVRIVEKGSTGPRENAETNTQYDKKQTAGRLALLRQRARENGGEYQASTKTLGWKASCTCNADIIPCLVLDPFGGSGTTAKVAVDLGRDYIICELNEKYVKLAQKRISRGKPSLGLA